jgi:hypothetical protein
MLLTATIAIAIGVVVLWVRDRRRAAQETSAEAVITAS